MYLNRLIEKTIKQAARSFPVIVITGPRQSGKSTLLNNLYNNKQATFIQLDDPAFRQLLQDDPLSYLENQRKPVIIDEIQLMPELLPYIKILVDRDRKPGQWLITGSQQFVVMKNISESLAGRAAILTLPTFQIKERKIIPDLANYILRGSYPELLVNKTINQRIWYSSYMQTYLERDLRSMMQIHNLREFENFLRLLAAYTAQEFNASQISAKIGISVPTVKRWVSVLEASYIVFTLPPYYKNYGKRIIKSPKLYFYDTGLVNYLLNIHETNLVEQGPMVGPLFETAVISELYKYEFSKGVKPELYYWRSQSGLEVDLIKMENGKPVPYEIKAATMIKPLFYKNLQAWLDLSAQPKGKGYLITNCSKKLPLPVNIVNIHWRKL